MRKVIIILLLVNLYACAKKETANKSLKEIAREVILASKNCALITVDSLGVANARAMDPFQPEDDFTIWMGTNSKSKKVIDIQNNDKVTLYYFDKTDPGYVTIKGTATLVDSKEAKEKYWKEEWKNFYKDRETNYLLIKFIPSQLNVISEKHGILGDSITWESPLVKFQ
ncbi:MAG: pyridoxamine 5'-phosphate oxidase family protein [Flavobacteriaceae bacterium]